MAAHECTHCPPEERTFSAHMRWYYTRQRLSQFLGSENLMNPAEQAHGRNGIPDMMEKGALYALLAP